jgi:hypothetical protein
MADSSSFTANVTTESDSVRSVSVSNVIESTNVSATVVTGAKGDKGDTGATGAAGVVQALTYGTGIDVDSTDPASPIVSLDTASIASLSLADSAVQNLSDLGVTSTAAELNYTDGVTSAIQTQLDGKSATGHTHTAANVTDFDTEVSNNTDVAANTAARHTHANKTILDATSASYTTADETKLDGIEAGAEVNTVTSVAGKTGSVTLDKTDVGLSNVANLAPADMPVSTAQQTALDGKANFPNTDSHVPVRDGSGAQSSLRYTSGTTGYTIGFRTADGQIGVGAPTDNTHATTKAYVDNADALKVTGVGRMFFQSTAPTSPLEGDLWVDLS